MFKREPTLKNTANFHKNICERDLFLVKLQAYIIFKKNFVKSFKTGTTENNSTMLKMPEVEG